MPVSVVFNQININNQEGNAAVARGRTISRTGQRSLRSIMEMGHR
ncbi:hypothetical protein QUF84_20570 [Fictibacillus enclensis]|nr:hypothetical protein [Fictibacillus enclensis]MDM5339597.1 hypothetical protein [Fictibacillus enclensis]